MFVFWTLISTTFPLTDFLIKEEDAYSIFRSLITSFPIFYVWFAFTPLIFWLGRRFSFGMSRLALRNFCIHVVLGFLIVTAYLFITSCITVPFVIGYFDFASIGKDFVKRMYQLIHFELIVYWAILGMGAAFDYYKKFREREIEASRLLIRSTGLEAQLARAQLDSLKMQLHPHFLFNTLHAISALMEDSPKRARRMIARLGELLRTTLDIADQQTITLEQEIALTRLYLDIEQERFGEKLQVKISAGAREMECLVPSLILQPLIENAIKHGITDQDVAVIEIGVERKNKTIKIVVRDNGPGFTEDAGGLQDGIGLGNTKARLVQLYGKDHKFNAGNAEEGGAEIEITIPCRHEKAV